MDDWPAASVTKIEAQPKFWGALANGARLLARLSLLSLVGSVAGTETCAATTTPSTEGSWIMMMVLVLIGVVLAFAAVKFLPERGLAEAPIRDVRGVATQSQVTYARKRIVPRFVPLGEDQNGVWVT